MKPKYVHDEVFNHLYTFMIGHSPSEVIKYCEKTQWIKNRKHKITADAFDSLNGFAFSTTLNSLIWVRNKSDIATLAHECIHAAFKVLDDRNILISAGDDEPLAYLVGFLIKKVREK